MDQVNQAAESLENPYPPTVPPPIMDSNLAAATGKLTEISGNSELNNAVGSTSQLNEVSRAITALKDETDPTDIITKQRDLD